jgi:uncharacterized membrane protein YfcA|tara:strand:+ start:1504 stop:2253 length:750 start_codon:yes stop_codon:yes gene_type:complete
MENLFYFIPENYLLIVLVILFSGFIRGFLGFGSGLITIPILSYLYSPIFAMVFNIAIEIPATIYLTYVGAKSCKFKEISPMFFAMMLTIPIGTIFLVSVNEQLIKIIMSILVIFFVLLIASGWKLKATVTKYVLTISGVISGLMQGATGMGGPPYATVLLSKGDSDNVTRGNILIMSTGIVISAIISFYMFNLFTKELLLTGLITSPIYILATYTGTKFFDLSGNRYYRNISLFSLGLIGVLTLIKAIF